MALRSDRPFVAAVLQCASLQNINGSIDPNKLIMSTHQLDPEDFISEVQKHPEVWDIRSEDYKYHRKRQRAWCDIASVFIDQFEELSADEKLNIYKKLQEKWRNIRDSFVKSMKSNSKKSYTYAPHLYFLNEVYKYSGPSEEEPVNEDDPKIKLIKKEKRNFDELNDADAWQSDDSNVELKRKKTNDIEFVDSFPDVGCSALYPEEDEDRSFFNSLLPAVRQFSMDQKLEFRSQVISIIKKIRTDVS